MKTIRREDTSLLAVLLNLLLKPIGKKLAAAKGEYPAGSPQLTPHKSASKRCDITERQVCGIWIYDMTAKSPAIHKSSNDTYSPVAKRRRLYYFAGGTWQMPPTPDHWRLCAELCNKIPNCTVSVISPPLAPNSPAPVAFPQLCELYTALMDAEEKSAAKGEGEIITFGGDSSGGQLALTLVLAMLSETKDHARKNDPDSIFVMSPSVQCTPMDKTDPKIQAVQKLDPLLEVDASNAGAAKWAGNWNLADPRLTPLNADVSVLVEHRVRLYGVTGDNDVRAPAALEFRDMCAKAGVEGEWLEWKGQLHCFPLMWVYWIREGNEGKDWIVDVLSR